MPEMTETGRDAAGDPPRSRSSSRDSEGTDEATRTPEDNSEMVQNPATAAAEEAITAENTHDADALIVSHLKERYELDQIYTWAGSKSLVVLTPPPSICLALPEPIDFVDEDDSLGVVARKYVDRVAMEDEIDDEQELPPHVYELAAKVYNAGKRRRVDQSVLIRGIAGAGKTFTAVDVVSSLCYLSSQHAKSARIAKQLRASLIIMNAFGYHKDRENNHASRWRHLSGNPAHRTPSIMRRKDLGLRV